MHEAFARERMSQYQRQAAAETLARHAAAARRWSRLERMAGAAAQRHRMRANAPASATG